MGFSINFDPIIDKFREFQNNINHNVNEQLDKLKMIWINFGSQIKYWFLVIISILIMLFIVFVLIKVTRLILNCKKIFSCCCKFCCRNKNRNRDKREDKIKVFSITP
ncbi:putative U5 protein [Holmes Jungle virus]|uniref:Putative U5 protein n=1 Tax=Holmes Jungle virus TaxID=2021721 RepID=A0A221LCG7_9RHAB|nr:putative U5 protein [Holmes Jungle virus]ASM90778.1 putative U5 protein [Holmes Jungle virus]